MEEPTAQCRERLLAENLVMTHGQTGYDLLKLILAIRNFLHDQGFAIGTGEP